MPTGEQHRDIEVASWGNDWNDKHTRKCSSNLISEIARDKTKHEPEACKGGECVFCSGNLVQHHIQQKIVTSSVVFK